MAIFRPSALLGPISGSLGSLTFKNTRHGPVIAQRLRRGRTSSPRLLASRARHVAILRAWSNLAHSQRLAWNSFASNIPHRDRLNIPRTKSGLGLFLAHNNPAYVLGLPQIDDPPFYTSHPPITDLYFTIEHFRFWYFHATIPPPLDRLYLIADGSFTYRYLVPAPPPAPHTHPIWRFKNWRQLDIIQVNVGPLKWSFPQAWVDAWGEPVKLLPFCLRFRLWHPAALASPYAFVSSTFWWA